ncbi:MAG: ABC transporter ATP-binding protein [Turicibacter sp.]|nr:ABC transporter ATP-binding protein [Turicibacter sp.]
MLELNGIVKGFSTNGGNVRTVLEELSLTVGAKESVAIVGRSGSGKSTLLKIISGMDNDFLGEYLFNKEEMRRKSSDKRARFRREKLGFITQRFDLLDDRNVYENIAIALSHLGLPKSEKKQKVAEILGYVGLHGYEKKFIGQLSGGEMQRVSIARAIIKKPALIIADEPTGSLDEETRDDILSLFKQMMEDGHQFIIVTHDKDVSKICDRILKLYRGTLINVS